MIKENNLFKPRRVEERLEKLTDFERSFIKRYNLGDDIFFYQNNFFYKTGIGKLWTMPARHKFKNTGEEAWVIFCLYKKYILKVCRWSETNCRWEYLSLRKLKKLDT